MRLFLDPNPREPDAASGGIRRVIDAQVKHLPEFGVQITRRIDKADVTAGHVDHLPLAAGKPFVEHCHGLMWSEYFDDMTNRMVNRDVVNAIIQADTFTVPSEWVANALSYGLLKTPHVIYHGIDADEWTPPAEHGGYVLWNKARADAVSDPADVMRLAREMPRTSFVSTIGKPAHNLKIIGVAPYQEHKQWIENAGVYLVTARETFGIGTLEALASGVPVAGWRHGGQREIIVEGETGYLAEYGDYAALAEAVGKCFAERARLSVNAREDVRKRWGWLDKIEQYAALYSCVLHERTAERPKVSVIVPCHNLGKYLPDALDSILRQTMTDWECWIVDDDSHDETQTIAQGYALADQRFQYTRTPANLKLPGTLNHGHARARGRYVMNLDADNLLPENALALLSDALDQHRDLHIVYGGLDTVSDDGSNRRPNAFPYPVYENFSWYGQIAHLNQLHSSAMMRREVMESANGYRARQWRAEDAEFWTRVSSFGCRIARVTTEPTLIYRWRQGSKSGKERELDPEGIDGDWCQYFPWRTAATGKAGHIAIEKAPHGYNNPHLVPFGAQGERTDKAFWDVPHRQEPLVSVIIPCGKGHREYLNDALDSLVGQLTNQWEAVVVNDTGEEWDTVPGAPFARVIQNTTGKHGAGAAKNIGVAGARGQFVFFLDADDMLEPRALVTLLQRIAQGQSRYVYCDALVPESPLANRVVPAIEYDQRMWLHNGLHTQAMLMLTEDARRIRFDEDLPAWEDWDFIVRCAIGGVCGERVAEPLLLYRKQLGQRSQYGDSHRQEIKDILRARYDEYATGAKPMAPCGGGCGGKANAIRQSAVMQTRVESVDKPIPPGMARMRYTGPRQAPVTYYANGHPYRAANTPKWRMFDARLEDVEHLVAMGNFTEIGRAQPIASAPAPAPVAPVVPPHVATPMAQPPPAGAPAPVTNDAMQKAIAAMEAATKEPIQPAAQPTTEWVGHPTSTEPLPPSVVTVASAVVPEPTPAPIVPKQYHGKGRRAR